MKQNDELNFLTETSWLTPTRKRVLTGVLCSLIVHAIGYTVFRFAPIAKLAMGIGQYQFVDEAYNRAILIDLKQPLRYPGGYIGFAAPTKTLDLEKIKEEEKKRQQALTEAKRRAEKAERERAEKAKKQANESQTLAKKNEPEASPASVPTPTPKPTPSGFKAINTRPIRDQIQRLYDLKQEGKLVFNETNLKVGVTGNIEFDGSISKAKVFIPSGNPQIDRAALAIVDAVSEAKALGPLSKLTSLSLVLTIDEQRAQLISVGFAENAEKASAMRVLAQSFLAVSRMKKSGDPASMIFLDNIQLTQTSNRITATISVPRQVAKDTLSKTMAKKAE